MGCVASSVKPSDNYQLEIVDDDDDEELSSSFGEEPLTPTRRKKKRKKSSDKKGGSGSGSGSGKKSKNGRKGRRGSFDAGSSGSLGSGSKKRKNTLNSGSNRSAKGGRKGQRVSSSGSDSGSGSGSGSGSSSKGKGKGKGKGKDKGKEKGRGKSKGKGKSSSSSSGGSGDNSKSFETNAMVATAGIKFKRKRVPKCDWIARDGCISAGTSMSDFEVKGKPIGRGACGFVKLARRRQDNRFYAIKCLMKYQYDREKDVRMLENEKRILEIARHPFIVHLFGSFQDEKFVYFVLEYIPGGELFTHLSDSNCFSENKAKFYCAEALSALEYIHSLNHMYRDLKPENCLIDEQGHLKMTDFGFAKEWNNDGRLFSKVGTPHYLAPEQLDARIKAGYTKAVDIWAWGCFTFELCAGESPFGTAKDTSYEVYLRVMAGKYRMRSGWSPELRDLIKKCLSENLTRRMAEISEIKTHRWFEGLDWDAVERRKLRAPFLPNIPKKGDRSNFHRYNVNEEKAKKLDYVKNALFSSF